MTPVAICWSGGKDSALTLSALRADPAWEPVALLTTFTRDFDRVSMHGVRRELIHAQAAALGLLFSLLGVRVISSASDLQSSSQPVTAS